MAKSATFLRGLRINELSFVDVPANKKAKVAIFKRGEPEPTAAEVAKAAFEVAANLVTDDSPDTWRAIAQPLFDSVARRIDTSNAADFTFPEFMNAVAAEMPDVHQELEKLLEADPAVAAVFNPVQTKETDDMAKTVAELEAALAETTTKLEAATAASTAATQAVADATKRADEAEAKVGELEKAADIAKADETATIEGQEIRKSVVGEQTFKVLKAQQDRIELNDLTKRAETEFAYLPGEPIAKAKVLRAVAKMDKEDREELEKMLKAGSAALGSMMKAKGKDGEGDDSDEITKAETKLDALVKAHREKNPGMTQAVAFDEVIQTPEGARLAEIVDGADPEEDAEAA